jgi:uncharacterized protein
VKFWDSSAIVPLIVEQSWSKGCRALLRADPKVVVWALTRTETISALQRLRREGGLADEALHRAEVRIQKLAERWVEVDALTLVRDEAEKLLRVHDLRAADALQLGAALIAHDGRPRGRHFVALDDALLKAAEREGFAGLRPRG